MSKNIGEFSHESQDDSRWDMGEVTPFGGEKDSGNATENLERDPSLSKQEKSAELDEARERVEEAYHKNAPLAPTIKEAPASRITHRENSVSQALKHGAVATGSLALTFASVGAMCFIPATIPLLAPAALLAADSVEYNINGVNGSMFKVDHKNHIAQRLNPLPNLIKYHGKTSSKIFEAETTKLFEGLKPGETYNTRSHSLTYMMLRKAQSRGLITDLTKEETGKKSRLFLENIVTRNWKALRSGKKHDIYNISFKVV